MEREEDGVKVYEERFKGEGEGILD